MGLSQFDENGPANGATAIKAAQTTTKVTAASWAAPFLRVDSIVATNTDVIAHVVDVWLLHSAVSYLLGSASVPAGAGTLGTVGVNLLTAALPATFAGLVLTSADFIQVSCEVTVTSTFEVDITVFGGLV